LQVLRLLLLLLLLLQLLFLLVGFHDNVCIASFYKQSVITAIF